MQARRSYRAIEEPAIWGMSPVDIKVALMRRGVTQSKIARKLGVSVTAVHQVVHGQMRSGRIEALIKAVILGDITV
jgi:transcriptional regulator with XRE-family HTH domain